MGGICSEVEKEMEASSGRDLLWGGEVNGG
jgi:hypothetical protein